MPTYSVDFSWDETVTVEAKNRDEAIKKLQQIMEDEDAHPDMNKPMKDVHKEIEDNVTETDGEDMDKDGEDEEEEKDEEEEQNPDDET